MADAWVTRVHREPEWDDRNRAEALGAQYADAARCRHCGNADSVVEIKDPRRREAVFTEHDRAYTLLTYVCVACAGIAAEGRRQADEAKRKNGGEKVPDDHGDGVWSVAVPRYDD